MDKSNIGSGAPNPELPSIAKHAEIEAEHSKPASSSKSSGRSTYSQDTVMRSESPWRREDEDEPDSKTPRLKHPSYMQFLIHCQDEMEKLASSIADDWNKALQEEADLIRKELQSPKFLALQQQRSTQFINEEFVRTGKDLIDPTKGASEAEAAAVTATAEERLRYEALLDRYTFIEGLSSLLSATKHAMETAPAEAMAASLAIGAGFASNFSQAPFFDSSSQIEAKTFHEAWKDAVPENSEIAQTGGWFSAMWSIGLVYQLSARNIASEGKITGKGPYKELSFAKEYARSLLESLNGHAFDGSIAALLAPVLVKNPQENGEGEVAAAAAKGKVVLLAMALALVVKLELRAADPEAEIDKDTFAAMIAGYVDFAKDDVHETSILKARLVEEIREALSSLPDEESQRVLDGIYAYIGKRPAIEGLLDQQTVIAETLIDSPFEQTIVDKRPLNA